MTINVQEAATYEQPVFYDNFYLVQYLLDKKVKFIHPVNCRSRLKKMVIASKLLDTLRVLGIISRRTLDSHNHNPN